MRNSHFPLALAVTAFPFAKHFRWRSAAALSFALIMFCLFQPDAQAASKAIIPPGVKLNTPELFFGDEFGHAVAIDGDTIVASAWRKNVGDVKQQGVVYIFERDANDPMTFNLSKTLTAGDAREYHGFGSAVAIDGDTVVVGAIYDDDNNHFQAGAAYVFERNHGGPNAWGEVKKLVDANFDDEWSEHGYMGESVAIHSDTIVVGAPKQRGKVFVFERDLGGENQWGEVQTLSIGEYWEAGSAGASLAFDGTRIVVGVSQSSIVTGTYNNEGAVFIFEQQNAEWVRTGKLTIGDDDPDTDYANNSRFGSAVALLGDTVYVGAPSLKIEDVSLAGGVFAFQHVSGTIWSPIGAMVPEEPAFNTWFGASLYAVEEGIFVASNEGANGTVYFYERSAAANTASVTGTLDDWTEAFNFSTTENVTGSRFGQPIAGSGNTFLAAASGYSSGLGTVYAYPLDALLDTTPATPTVKGVAYLPMIIHDATQTPIATVVGTLSNNGTLTGPDNFVLGATANTISGTASVEVTIATVSPPVQPLPESANKRSSFFLVSGKANLLVDIDSPFVVGIPVPSGADTAHLALAYLQSPDELTDGPVAQPLWAFLPGAYDAASNHFYAKLPFLLEEGSNLALVEHPDFESPLNAPSGQSAAVSAKPFTAFCIDTTFPSPADCTDAMKDGIKQFADTVYSGMTGQYGFPDKVRLLDSGSKFIVSESVTTTAANATYGIYLFHTSDPICDDIVGRYNPFTGMLIICLDSGQGIDDTVRDTIVHEMFHAFQYSYDNALRDRQNGVHEHWIVEGMAMAAERSFALGKMARSFYYGETNLRKIDIAITEGLASDLVPDEYLAQDFWVLLGQYNNVGLGYLDEILLYGGVTLNGVHDAWNFAGPGPANFNQIYWEWVKNQIIEHTYDLGGGLGDVCKVTPNALTNGTHITFPFSQMYYPADYTWVELAPLTAQLVEVQIPHTRNGALIQVRYEECEGHTDPQAERTCHDGMKPLMRAKVYVEEEANCHLSSLPGVLTPYEGERMISPIVQGQRYFVLVANADKDKPHKFAIALE